MTLYRSRQAYQVAAEEYMDRRGYPRCSSAMAISFTFAPELTLPKI